MDLLAALALLESTNDQPVAEQAATPVVKKQLVNKPRIRMTWLSTGKICLVLHSTSEFKAGEQCRHCHEGQYYHFQRGTWEVCYQCSGKGRLSPRDIGFLSNRKATGRPISRVSGNPYSDLRLAS